MKLQIDIKLRHKRTGTEVLNNREYTFTGYGSTPPDDVIKSVVCDCNGIECPSDWDIVELSAYDPTKEEEDDE